MPEVYRMDPVEVMALLHRRLVPWAEYVAAAKTDGSPLGHGVFRIGAHSHRQRVQLQISGLQLG